MIISTAEAADEAPLSWTEARYDSENTGHVEGQGLIDSSIQPIIVEEERGIETNLISVDFNGDSVNDLMYGNGDDSFIVREGPYSDPTVVENIFDLDGRISPVVYHARLGGPQRLVVLTSSSNVSSILFIGEGSQSVVNRIDVTGTLQDGWKILDVDQDGNNELVVTTFQGIVHSIDLLAMEIDWSRSIGPGLIQPIGYFEHEGAPKVALTSGITVRGWEKIGSKDLYILNGRDGTIERVVQMSEEILSTPPSIHVSDGEIYISYCNYTGTAFIYAYNSGEMYDTVEWEELDRAPYWRHVNVVELSDQEGVYIVFQGDRSVLVYDLFLREVVWVEYIKHPLDFIDSLLADINNDGLIELMLLRVNRTSRTSTFFVKTLADGVVLQEFQLDVPDPRGLVVSDMDGDGYLEVCVVFSEHLVFIDKDEYVNLRRVSVDGIEREANSTVSLYAMYRLYNLSVEMELSARSDYIHRMALVIDPAVLGLRAEIDIINESIHNPVTEHIMFNDVSIHSSGNNLRVDIYLMVGWSFPHEDPFAVEFEVEYRNGFETTVGTSIQFRVENDISIIGDLKLTSNGSSVEPGEWLNSRLPVQGDGLSVTYQDAPEFHVDERYFIIETSIVNHRNIGVVQIDGTISFDINVSDLETGTYQIQVILAQHPLGIEVNELSIEVRVDAEPIRIVSVFPSYDGWHSSRDLYMGLVTSDNNGSGVDVGSIHIRLGDEDTFNITSVWATVESGTLMDLGDGFQLFGTDESLDSGIYLYQWRLTDKAGHEYTQTQRVELKVDIVKIEFVDPSPSGWVNSTTFQTGVTIRFGSPYTVTRSTIQYSLWNPPMARDWTDHEFSSGETREIRTAVNIAVTEGIASFIQWRVVVNDTTVHYSKEHHLYIDTTPPEIGDVTPDLNTLFNIHNITMTFEIIDPLSGIDPGSIGINYLPSDGPARALDHEVVEGSVHRVVISIKVDDVFGKANEILVEVADMAGNDYKLGSTFVININEPPAIHSISPKNDSEFRHRGSITFSVDSSDPDDEALNISWRSNRDGHIGYGNRIQIENLTPGAHEISVTVTDESTNHVNGTVRIKVRDENDGGSIVHIPGSYIALIIVLATVIITSMVVVRYRRHG